MPIKDFLLIHFFYEMDTEDFELAVTAVILLRRVRKRRFKRKRRKIWVGAIFKERKEKGAYYQLINEMRLNDREFYFK